MTRPLASLSLDLDNLWSYMKTHGDAGWDAYPPYLPPVGPPTHDVLRSRAQRITYMIVGKDADDPANHDALRAIGDAGHEIGNHSYHHEPWLHLYETPQLIAELQRTEDALENATGQRPTGFRGPGYSCSVELLHLLHQRGYAYDASTLPTWLGPLARTYYFWTAQLTPEERATRKKLFGGWRDVLRPIKPYAWSLDGGQTLPEIPVTTWPLLRVPFHLSYVLYLSRFNAYAARVYFRHALRTCKLLRVQPSVLLHPLDFVGGDEVEELAFFPAMELPGAVKRARVTGYLRDLQKRFDVVPMGTHAESLKARRLKPRRPDLPPGAPEALEASA